MANTRDKLLAGRGYEIPYGEDLISILKLQGNVETLAAHKTLVVSDYVIQKLDPDGTDRNVVLPAEALSTNLVYIIYNMGTTAGEDLAIRNDTPTTLLTLNYGDVALCTCDGTTWTVTGIGGSGSLDALRYMGAIDCSANPNYPAADAGHVYIVSVAGKIGGASGTVVTAGDMCICKVDSSAAGDEATVGANWDIVQANIDLTNIAITGGTIDGTAIGGTTPAAGSFTQVQWDKGADVASASALTLGADGNYFDITGTTAITSIGTVAVGFVALLHFDGALTFTHNAIDLILPGGVDITTAAGDEAIVVEYDTGKWRCVNYQRASFETAFSDIKQAATSSATGVVEIATDAETVTGTDNERVVTPANLTAKMVAPGSIGTTTPGIVRGAVDEIIQASSDTLTVAEVKGTQINNYGQGAVDNLQTLPTAAEGMNFMAVCGTAQASNYFGFKADTNDKFYLDGTAGSDNGIVKIAAPVVSAKIYFHTFQTGAATWDWAADTISGAWIAE